MSYEKVVIPIIVNGVTSYSSTIHLWDTDVDDENKVKILFSFQDISISQSAHTYWEALQEVRRILEGHNILLICYGSSLNVYPSGMQLNMGVGAWAYKMTIGCPAMKKDVVWIFATAEDVIPATISKQEEYYQDWWRSLD